jgi:uncharacterized protein
MWSNLWTDRALAWLSSLPVGDVAHDGEHLRRVVNNAQQLAVAERANLAVVLPAAWLHDCVLLPKNHPDRQHASRHAAQAACAWLAAEGYPAEWLPAIHHAILAHSYAGLQPAQTIEAQVVQDADRLDAIGAVGLARCLLVAGQLQRSLYHPTDPFAVQRTLDDHRYALDHFYCKLLKLPAMLHTATAKAMAVERAAFLQQFISQLATEIGATPP